MTDERLDDHLRGRPTDTPDKHGQDPEAIDEWADEGEGEPALPALGRSRGEAVGQAIGSFMGGIEQAVFQRRPPAIELVRQATPVRATTGDGLELTLDLPDPDARPRGPTPDPDD